MWWEDYSGSGQSGQLKRSIITINTHLKCRTLEIGHTPFVLIHFSPDIKLTGCCDQMGAKLRFVTENRYGEGHSKMWYFYWSHSFSLHWVGSKDLRHARLHVYPGVKWTARINYLQSLLPLVFLLQDFCLVLHLCFSISFIVNIHP